MTSNRFFHQLRTVALVAASGIALAACLGSSMPSPEMSSTKIPVVSQTVMVFDLGSGAGGLSGERQRSLAEWLDGIGVNYGDRISIDDAGTARPAMRGDVADILARHGLLLSDSVPVTSGSGGSARVIVMRATAAVPGCPDWTRPSNPELEASKMSNYGCAVTSNIAAMVVDANDLVSGKPHTGMDALTSSKAIETYRTKAGTATDKAKSSVGQVSSN